MLKTNVALTGRERTFGTDEIVVSKTNLQGIITYANQTFIEVSGYTEAELLGRPHSLIRHPDMPRCVFKLLWDTIQSGAEIFAYVVNQCKNGDHYWVFAHVTPTFDPDGQITGYHSSRRVPEPSAVAQVKSIYAQLLEREEAAPDWRDGMQASTELLLAHLSELGMSYDEFIFSL